MNTHTKLPTYKSYSEQTKTKAMLMIYATTACY